MARAGSVASKNHTTIDTLSILDSTNARRISNAVSQAPKGHEIIILTVCAGKLVTEWIRGFAALALNLDRAEAVIALIVTTTAVVEEQDVRRLDSNCGGA